MNFGNINGFYYLLLLVILIAIFYLGYQKKVNIINLIRFPFNKKKEKLSIFIMILGVFLIVFSLTDPEFFKGYEKYQKKGLDIYFLIDVSKSMLSEDIKPSRIRRSKEIISSVIDELKGDRVGFIPFSSTAYIQMPLTDDYDMAKMFLDVIDTNMISGGGTNIKKALELAEASFKKSAKGDKVIILISDGEVHNESGINESEKIDKSIKIYTIGVGSLKGSLIPIVDKIGNRIDYKKDKKGNYVLSKLDVKTLEEIAKNGNGKFYMSTIAGDEIQKLTSKINLLKREELGIEKLKIYKKLYQYFLGIGILIFLMGYLYGKRGD
ncbi:VWA domain-containing protein [Haliovirga abyssi]|uniref:BatB protein n=1 Tax=Haliovirga abyssi TaxID=2996794 RepID=A0AAU9D9R2_9FUSO|nr:VWA domain-containing protein [Haliovirga abyssi]BDU50331.1 BatB protein [Haliovirga abyssi]